MKSLEPTAPETAQKEAAGPDTQETSRTRQDDAIKLPLPEQALSAHVQGVSIELIPEQMRNAKRWLDWRAEPSTKLDGKPRKVPHYPNGKRRCHELDSSEDIANLGTYDEAMRALATGNFSGLGFALGPDGTGNYWQGIDLDDIPHRIALVVIANNLPGYTEISPSRKGKHAIGYGKYFETLGSNASGIEAYSEKRFFTVTGKGTGNGEICCIADFVEQQLQPMHGKSSKCSNSHAPDRIAIVLEPETETDLRSALLCMRADDRALWIRMGYAVKGLGDLGRGLWLEWSATSEKFDPGEAARTWDTLNPDRTGYRAVFAEAQRQGWGNPRLSASPTKQAPTSTDQLARCIISLSTSDPTHKAIPHYVDKWIPQNEVTLFAGHGGGGKSYVAMLIAVNVVLGRPIGQLETQQTKVLFFSGEDGKEVLWLRLVNICRTLNIAPVELEGKLHLLDASDIDPALHREQRITRDGRQQIITETVLLDALAALTNKMNVGLVVVDNASDTFDDDEIKRARVGSFIRSLRARLARPGRAVLLLAHINKQSANGGRQAGLEDYSGSTAWHNSVRSRLSLIPDGEGTLRIDHMKANLGPKAAPIVIMWSEGVPVVHGCHLDIDTEHVIKAERDHDIAYKAILVELIKDFDQRGERVTTATQGPATTFKLLSACPNYPKGMKRDRLTRLLRMLEAEGVIFRRWVKTPDRKQRECFTCIPEGDNDP